MRLVAYAGTGAPVVQGSFILCLRKGCGRGARLVRELLERCVHLKTLGT